MEELGVAATEDLGIQWVMSAILGWTWSTLILQVGRIALALELILLLPRIYSVGSKKVQSGSWAILCHKLRSNLPAFGAVVLGVIIVDWWLLSPWM
ncbi:MAG: hypothetical protein HOH43_06340, partial [Candidatus Latescibacteria bacterium]|nr:hypothetical protein [Candidatus Latescibacterota bacterium]